jgi:ABC-type hemin transport system ATPase subunit
VAAGSPGVVLTPAHLHTAYGVPLAVGVHPETGSPFVTVPALECAR